MNGSIQYNNRPQTATECTVRPKKTNTKQNILTVVNKVENDGSNESPRNVDNIPDPKKMSTMIQIIKCNMAE